MVLENISCRNVKYFGVLIQLTGFDSSFQEHPKKNRLAREGASVNRDSLSFFLFSDKF